MSTPVPQATVAAGSAVGSAVGEAVDDSASWAKEKRQSVIMHTKKTTLHTVEQDETIGIIAAKYKTTVEQILKLNKELLVDGDVEPGMEVKVPVADRRKSSNKHRTSSDFLSSLSSQLGLEGGEETEGADSTETRCLILSSGGAGPRVVSQGFLILDTDTLVLSWGREDPVTVTREEMTNIALLYGTLEQPDFNTVLVDRLDQHSGYR
jgi:LysM repeat protein